MNVFGVELKWPENLEVQAVAMKIIGLAIICSALLYLRLIDERVAAMVMGGALGGSAVWLVGFRQEYGWRSVVMQAAVAMTFALIAELLSSWL